MSYRPYRKPGINPIWVLVGVNIAIFLATLFNPPSIYSTFGLIPTEVVSQPWTFLTYMFVHAGWSHIIFNMITLFFFGTFAMALIGETHFLVTYFVGGIVGGVFYFLFAPVTHSTFTVLVGASGAIYALGGLLMVMRPKVRVLVFPLPVEIPLWVAVLVGFVLVTFIPGVAWEAHLGGMVYGAVVGYYFRRRESRRY